MAVRCIHSYMTLLILPDTPIISQSRGNLDLCDWEVLGSDSREICRVLFGVKEELGILEEAYGPGISMTPPTFNRLCPLDTCASFHRKLRAVL